MKLTTKIYSRVLPLNALRVMFNFQAQKMNDPQAYNKWVAEFWKTFSHQGGY